MRKNKLQQILKEVFNIDPEEELYDTIKGGNASAIYSFYKLIKDVTKDFNEHPHNVYYPEEIERTIFECSVIRDELIIDYGTESMQSVRLAKYILDYFNMWTYNE